ncbi:MAG: class I SAM-dependent methyltransferase [Bryobacterales bacterium]|nr:class I SAM-dependent methyltransferase [Bryobacterales bacterium]
MTPRRLQQHWDKLGKEDAMWAILTDSNRKGGRWTPEEFFAEGRNEIAAVMEYLRKHGAPPRFRHALDFGCGIGRLSQALADYCETVTGLDIAPSMVESAQKWNRHGERCRYLVNGTPDLRQLPDQSFDLIYSNIVLQHMPTAMSWAYLGEFVRVLMPGGLLCFQIPSEPSGTLIGLLLRILPVPVVRLIRKMDMYGTTPERVKAIVEAAGASIIDTQSDTAAGPHWKSFRYLALKPGKAWL